MEGLGSCGLSGTPTMRLPRGSNRRPAEVGREAYPPPHDRPKVRSFHARSTAFFVFIFSAVSRDAMVEEEEEEEDIMDKADRKDGKKKKRRRWAKARAVAAVEGAGGEEEKAEDGTAVLNHHGAAEFIPHTETTEAPTRRGEGHDGE